MPVAWSELAGWGIACFVASALATVLARRYALGRRLIDEPGERRSHAVATPRGGGIAIVAVMLVALAGVAVLVPSRRLLAIAALAGLLLVAGVGWIDDHRPLSARLRLLAHAVAAALLAAAVHAAGAGIVVAAVTFALAIGLVNAWNFMDGINGIAASQAAAVAAGCALLAVEPATRLLALALLSACLGFLPFNFPMAKIFLGDVGSGALGFLLAVLMVLVVTQPPGGAGADGVLPWGLLLPLSAFLVDAGLTLTRRIWRGERWWTPHVQHAYQRWAAAAGDHRRVTLAYLGWTFMGIAVMVGTWGLDGPVIIAAVSVWYLGGGIVWAWVQSRHRQVNEEGRA